MRRHDSSVGLGYQGRASNFPFVCRRLETHGAPAFCYRAGGRSLSGGGAGGSFAFGAPTRCALARDQDPRADVKLGGRQSFLTQLVIKLQANAMPVTKFRNGIGIGLASIRSGGSPGLRRKSLVCIGSCSTAAGFVAGRHLGLSHKSERILATKIRGVQVKFEWSSISGAQAEEIQLFSGAILWALSVPN